MQRTLSSVAAGYCLLLISHSAQAEVSLTATAVSDYTLNGISQTQGDPALQVSLDWGGPNGLYIGAWTSNVDFGNNDTTSQEIDYYIGKYWQLNEKTGLDTSFAYYTYHGASYADDFNYPEVIAKFGFNSSLGDSELNFAYTNDNNGLDVDNTTVQLAHKFKIAEGQHIRLAYLHAKSGDANKWAWGGSDADTYDHYRAEYLTSWNKLDVNLAVEDTNDLGAGFEGDSRVVLSVGKTFGF